MKQAKIFCPAKTSTQSGRAKTKSWILQFTPETRRQPEPLMGWVSSEDTLNQIKLKFEDKAQAIQYAEKMGLTYEVIEPHLRKIVPRNYLQNFKP